MTQQKDKPNQPASKKQPEVKEIPVPESPNMQQLKDQLNTAIKFDEMIKTEAWGIVYELISSLEIKNLQSKDNSEGYKLGYLMALQNLKSTIILNANNKDALATAVASQPTAPVKTE